MPSAEPLLLDTHVWVSLLEGRGLKSALVGRVESAAHEGKLHISAITPWEIAMLAAKERLRLEMNTMEWMTRAIRRSQVRIVPLEVAIAIDSAELAGFHGDPADRILVASSRYLQAPLVTRDRAILDYAKGGYLRTVAA